MSRPLAISAISLTFHYINELREKVDVLVKEGDSGSC